jgi:hypothetical protein
MKKLLLLLMTVLLMAGTAQAQTTTYTGTIRDLSMNPVTAGQVTFTLTPSTDSTLAGTGRFTPTTITCNINGNGTLSGYVGGVVSGPCTVASNTALSPSGTSYRICVQAYNATPGSCFYDYATTTSKDISTVAPTLNTGPLNDSGIPGPPGCVLGTTCVGALTTVPLGGQSVIQPAHTYTNFNSLSISVGTPTAPITNLTYQFPLFSSLVYDASPGDLNNGCGGNSGVGLGNPVAVHQICVFASNQTGTPATVPLYILLEGMPGYSGYLAGTSTNVVANGGSTPASLFHNTTLSDNSGWPITGCTRSGGVITVTVNTNSGTTPFTGKIGNGYYISGNSACNSGPNAILLATSVSSSGFTATQGGVNVSTPVSGGNVSNNHTAWSFEFNMVNNAWDPGAIDVNLGNNVLPFWGATSTQQGNFPGSAAFFNTGKWYTGLFVQDALDAGIIIGNPTVASGLQAMQFGIRFAPKNLANASANFCSQPLQFQTSVYNGSTFTKPSMTLQTCANSGVNAHSYFSYVSSLASAELTDGMQWIVPDGSAATPAYSTAGDATGGLYRNSALGTESIASGGVDIADFGSGGINLHRATSAPSFVASGTHFTASGCAAVAFGSAGPTSGSLQIRSGGACSIVITMGGSMAAPTGWSCSVNDETTANLWRETGSTTTTVTIAGTGVANDVIAVGCIGN